MMVKTPENVSGGGLDDARSVAPGAGGLEAIPAFPVVHD